MKIIIKNDGGDIEAVGDYDIIMIILSDEEKQLISNMNPEDHHFCIYPESKSIKEIEDFMESYK